MKFSYKYHNYISLKNTYNLYIVNYPYLKYLIKHIKNLIRIDSFYPNIFIDAVEDEINKVDKSFKKSFKKYINSTKKLQYFVNYIQFNKTALYKICKKFTKTFNTNFSHKLKYILIKKKFSCKKTEILISTKLNLLNYNDLECSICLDIIYNPILLNCGHVFCGYCIYQNIKICPLCREPILNKQYLLFLDDYIKKKYKKEYKKKFNELFKLIKADKRVNNINF